MTDVQTLIVVLSIISIALSIVNVYTSRKAYLKIKKMRDDLTK